MVVLDTPASEVYPRLWVGPHQESCPSASGFTLLVLTAFQHQTGPYRLATTTAPLTDDAFTIIKGERERCLSAAQRVVHELGHGGKVLVTCRAGQNRSSWVAGRAMVMLGVDADEVVRALKQKRNFANWFFEQDLLGGT